MSIKAIIFDADGVLINGEMFSTQLDKDYGISWQMTAPFFTGPMKDCILGKSDLKQVLVPYLQTWGWQKSVDEFIDYWHKSEHNIDEELITYIQELRQHGIICCLATNQTKYRFEYMLKEMGFSNIFDKTYASAHLGYKKPDSAFYEKIMVDLKPIEKDRVLFWDDTQENIDAAKGFGIHAELYTNFTNFKQKINQYIN